MPIGGADRAHLEFRNLLAYGEVIDETTRVHHAPRRRGSHVAARGTRAAGRDATIGFLSSRGKSDSANVVVIFRQGLSEVGFVEGENVAIEYRWADGQYDRLSG